MHTLTLTPPYTLNMKVIIFLTNEQRLALTYGCMLGCFLCAWAYGEAEDGGVVESSCIPNGCQKASRGEEQMSLCESTEGQDQLYDSSSPITYFLQQDSPLLPSSPFNYESICESTRAEPS